MNTQNQQSSASKLVLVQQQTNGGWGPICNSLFWHDVIRVQNLDLLKQFFFQLCFYCSFLQVFNNDEDGETSKKQRKKQASDITTYQQYVLLLLLTSTTQQSHRKTEKRDLYVIALVLEWNLFLKQKKKQACICVQLLSLSYITQIFLEQYCLGTQSYLSCYLSNKNTIPKTLSIEWLTQNGLQSSHFRNRSFMFEEMPYLFFHFMLFYFLAKQRRN